MTRHFVFACIAILFAACSTPKSVINSSRIGNTRTIPVQNLNDYTYQLNVASDDATYGYTQENPIKVGGKMDSGPTNERRFLNALLGPNGEQVTYVRLGSCCEFKTSNGLLGNAGLLDKYEVSYGDTKEILYLNMYDKGDLKIPVGFTAKK